LRLCSFVFVFFRFLSISRLWSKNFCHCLVICSSLFVFFIDVRGFGHLLAVFLSFREGFTKTPYKNDQQLFILNYPSLRLQRSYECKPSAPAQTATLLQRCPGSGHKCARLFQRLLQQWAQKAWSGMDTLPAAMYTTLAY
jgi:hypothetical protein